MAESGKSVRQLTHEFFEYYPDYFLCRTLAENTRNDVTTYSQAIGHLSRKAWAWEKNRREIEEKLDRRVVHIQGRPVRIKDLSLRQIIHQEDAVLEQIIAFYFKHPYAHGRTWKSRLLPSWTRSFFLRVLLGHARQRGLELSYRTYFDIITLL
ncbi:MAG: hypothetical protein ACE5JX_05045 [Acidobacteriota bacterium]